jgi:hypothetical protein
MITPVSFTLEQRFQSALDRKFLEILVTETVEKLPRCSCPRMFITVFTRPTSFFHLLHLATKMVLTINKLLFSCQWPVYLRNTCRIITEIQLLKAVKIWNVVLGYDVVYFAGGSNVFEEYNRLDFYPKDPDDTFLKKIKNW